MILEHERNSETNSRQTNKHTSVFRGVIAKECKPPGADAFERNTGYLKCARLYNLHDQLRFMTII